MLTETAMANTLRHFETERGRIGLYAAKGKLLVTVTVLDVRACYGRTQLRITGTDGYGDAVWVDAVNVTTFPA